MKSKNYLVVSFISAILFLLSSCSSTLLVEDWSDPQYKGPALQKILVIGVIKNTQSRYAFEDEFAILISAGNRKGIASYTLLPDLEKQGNKESVLIAVKQTGADGVMIVTTHGLISQQRVTPPTFDYALNGGGGHSYSMFGYYNYSHSLTYNPGHTVSDALLRIDTKLFDVKSEKIIWSGKTESYNPSSPKEVVEELERLVMRNMRKSGVIE